MPNLNRGIQVLLALAGLGSVVGKLACPAHCECSRGGGGGECNIEVTCKGIRHFPLPKQYPEGIDCLFLNSPELRFLADSEKEEGLRSLPTTLRRLDLSESRLKHFPEAGLGYLEELRVLNLEFNEITSLPEKTFHGLRRLKVLWLTGNHYDKSEKEYKKMKQAGNNLQVLHEDQFEGLQSLQVLLMHHNKLKELPEKVFRDVKRLRVVKLLDNPWKPKLTKKHPALVPLVEGGVTKQLDIRSDSGDSLEDYWEETGTYLSDDFQAGPLPKQKREL
eukprot:TRINITY_DN39551_c0_g1_i1.p1 TRINITY_DN39551_c0_g1~~TRINITY_DN39551_c0_g1_i1.p1  ORF type:complete len:276 (+),score=53.03 TRINITY_DN39551_c0_g1_i1:54-881(+)